MSSGEEGVWRELAKPLDGILPPPQPSLPQFNVPNLHPPHTLSLTHSPSLPPPHLPLFTLDGDSTGGRRTGDLVGEVCGEGCDGREGRREAGSLPAHVPVVALSRAAGSSGGRSGGGVGEMGGGGGGGGKRRRGRRGKRGKRREEETRKGGTEEKQERILSTQQQIHSCLLTPNYH